MRILIAATFSVFLTSSASAEDAPWPRYLDNQGIGITEPGDFYAAQAARQVDNPWINSDVLTFTEWRTLVATNDAGGQFPTDAKTLDAQRKAYTAYRRGVYNRIIAEGGCNAPSLPVEYAAACWQGGRSANPSGGAVGESLGGSE